MSAATAAPKIRKNPLSRRIFALVRSTLYFSVSVPVYGGRWHSFDLHLELVPDPHIPAHKFFVTHGAFYST